MKIEVNCMAKSRETALYYDPVGGLLFLGYFLLSLGMGNFGTFLGPMFFAFGLFTVGFALGRAGFAQCADIVEAPEQPMLVLDGFTSKRLDVLLRELRQQGVSVPYKAIVTEHNLPWTLRALYDELVREHEAMHG